MEEMTPEQKAEAVKEAMKKRAAKGSSGKQVEANAALQEAANRSGKASTKKN